MKNDSNATRTPVKVSGWFLLCVNTVKKPLLQAGRGINFAARNVKISLMSINQGKRKGETKERIENRNVNIIRAIHSDINLATLKTYPLIAQGYGLRRRNAGMIF